MRRETIAHILHLQSHHPVHLLMMLMLAAHPFVTDESDESQHAHYQQADNQEQDDSKGSYLCLRGVKGEASGKQQHKSEYAQKAHSILYLHQHYLSIFTCHDRLFLNEFKFSLAKVRQKNQIDKKITEKLIFYIKYELKRV